MIANLFDLNLHGTGTDLEMRLILAEIPLGWLRFAYCALSSLTILNALDRVNVDACVDWILPHPWRFSLQHIASGPHLAGIHVGRGKIACPEALHEL